MDCEKNEIAAIVVTYNRFVLLTECIAALGKQTFSDFDILIIDNASTDGTGEKLSGLVNRKIIQYFNTGSNIGGAGGFNYGIKTAYQLGYKYFWIMDDDTIPTESALSEILKAKELIGDEFGFLCSNVMWVDGSICLQNGAKRSASWKESDYLDNGICPVDTATFVSFFVSRAIVERVGLPIKEFFIWADDINYCIRISKIKQGYAVFRSKVIHKTPANIDTNIVYDRTEKIPRYFYEYRNRFYIARTEHELPAYLWSSVKRILRIVISSKDHKLLRIRYLLKGLFSGLSFNPEVEYVNNKQ